MNNVLRNSSKNIFCTSLAWLGDFAKNQSESNGLLLKKLVCVNFDCFPVEWLPRTHFVIKHIWSCCASGRLCADCCEQSGLLAVRRSDLGGSLELSAAPDFRDMWQCITEWHNLPVVLHNICLSKYLLVCYWAQLSFILSICLQAIKNISKGDISNFITSWLYFQRSVTSFG